MKSAPNDLTVLVFKENSVARTFRVPIQWISKLGLIAGITVGIAVLGIFVSAKYYFVARQASRAADPTYIRDLEKEVASLQANIKSLESKTVAPILSVNNPTPQTSAPNTSTAQNTDQHPSTPATNTAATAHAPLIFSALPSEVESPPAGADIPIIIYDPHVNWAGRTLKVQFFIQYTKEDKGNQQGRIAVLARGAETLIAYPPGILNSGNSASLIAPDKGEYFSVSHIREVKADFGPMKSNTALKEVEIFLFGTNDKLLVHQILTPGTNGPAASAPLVTPMITDTPVQDPALEKQTQ